MKIESELAREAAQLVTHARAAILAVADARGHPHTMWMTPCVTSDLEEIISITAPSSQKVASLRQNPRAEWMFASASLETLVYLSGHTRIIEGVAAKRYWDRVPGKSQAYYRKYCAIEDYRLFSVIRTEVDHIELCKPCAYTKTVLFTREVPPALCDYGSPET